MQFQITSTRENREIPQLPRLEFIEKILAYNFDLSEADDNISSPLNRWDIAD